MKRRPVRWAEPASLDLIEILEFVQYDRPEAARKLGRAILQVASRLSRHPRRGRIVPELLEHGISDYRQVLVAQYRVIYTSRNSADIVAVVDGRRDLQAALFQRLIR